MCCNTVLLLRYTSQSLDFVLKFLIYNVAQSRAQKANEQNLVYRNARLASALHRNYSPETNAITVISPWRRFQTN